MTSNQVSDVTTLLQSEREGRERKSSLHILKSMVSLQTSFSQGEERLSPNLEIFSSKKRKWQDEGQESKNNELLHEGKLCKKEQVDHIELNLDAPLPLEWQRCLDIKSGQIHFYNTRTHKRTSKDPRSTPEPPPPSPHPMLDLELNLNLKYCNNEVVLKHESRQEDRCQYADTNTEYTLDVDRKEMVAAVCMKCHMLVVMCKASPSCPNCKFVHGLEGQGSPPSFNRPEFRLLCCKDIV